MRGFGKVDQRNQDPTVLKQRKVRRDKRPLERTIENAANAYANALGWRHRKMNGLGNKAWPDQFYLPPHRSPTPKPMRRGLIMPTPLYMKPFWVEFKRLGEEPTPLQYDTIADLIARGEDVIVCDNIEDFKREINKRTW